MSALDFSFEIYGSIAGSSLRLWVDDAAVQDLHSEVEVPLERHGNRWTARLTSERPSRRIACMWLRLAIRGKPGAAWRMEVRDRGVLLLRDADELVMAKEWLVATCHCGDTDPMLCAV